MATAVNDLYLFLEAQGLAGGSTGWDLVRRRMMDEPVDNQVVVLAEDGGVAPEIKETSGLGDTALEDPAVLVTVRANEWDSDASRAKAGDIMAALHGQRNITVGQTTYLRIVAQTPEPIFAGFDEKGRPLHTISFRMLGLVTAS